MLKPLINLMLLALLTGCAGMPGPDRSDSDQERMAQPMPPETRVLYDRAVWSARNGREDEAIRLFTQMTDERPDIAIGYTNLGLLQLRKNQLDEAQAALKKAIALDPNDAIAYNHLGITYRQQGDFKQARAAYNQALAVREDYANAHLNLGILLDIYLQELPAALDHYQQYLSYTEDPQVEKWVVDLERRIAAGRR